MQPASPCIAQLKKKFVLVPTVADVDQNILFAIFETKLGAGVLPSGRKMAVGSSTKSKHFFVPAKKNGQMI